MQYPKGEEKNVKDLSNYSHILDGVNVGVGIYFLKALQFLLYGQLRIMLRRLQVFERFSRVLVSAL